MTTIEIQIPTNFTSEHEQVVINYLSDNLRGHRDWKLAFTAFDLLDNAYLVMPNGHYTFRSLYLEVVDKPLADSYIEELLALDHVAKESKRES